MKNTNVDNKIIFIDKRTELDDKHTTSKSQLNKLKGKSKIIGYQEQKKIMVHKAKKKKFHNSKLYKLRKKILISLIIILSLFTLTFLYNKFYKPNSIKSSKSTFVSENTNISGSDISLYSSIISNSVQKVLGIKYDVKVLQIHKNGNLVYSNGYFNVPDEGDINFDMILQNFSPYSLKINGYEYIKK